MIDSFFHFGQAKLLRGVCLLAILGGVFGETSLVLGQSTALLTGTVVDPSGAAVPGAEIVCQSRDTAISHRMTTDSNGLFRFPDLPIGVYDVTANRSGETRCNSSL